MLFFFRKDVKLNLVTALRKSRKLEEDHNELSLVNDSLDPECIKMREYIKNLTQRCEEWEICYKRQETTLCDVEEQYAEALKKEFQRAETRNQSTQCNINEEEDGKEPQSIPECTECKYLRKAIKTESSALSILKKESFFF